MVSNAPFFFRYPFTIKWVWYDGPCAPADHEDLKLPNGEIT